MKEIIKRKFCYHRTTKLVHQDDSSYFGDRYYYVSWAGLDLTAHLTAP